MRNHNIDNFSDIILIYTRGNLFKVSVAYMHSTWMVVLGSYRNHEKYPQAKCMVAGAQEKVIQA